MKKQIKIYQVGGSVRDQLLGIEPKDLDYVVVGADLQWMLDQGFKQVGASFPVFLHPETCDEYAMARREKKVAPGYQGFEFEFGPDVTLEEDLSRRDLSMNSIAYDRETQTYIDPYGGIADLRAGIIRHTSEAFAEDPLRVLRTARFAARYGFSVAPETKELCKQLVDAGEIDELSADRIWGELAKLFSEKKTSIGIQFLYDIGAFRTKRLHGLLVIPNNARCYGVHSDHEVYATDMEKMTRSLHLQFLSKDQLEQFRVPVHIAREAKFFQEIFDLTFSYVILDGYSASDLRFSKVVKTFDQFREEFKRGDLVKAKAFTEKSRPGKDFSKFFDSFEIAIAKLFELDFTELVKGMKPAEIKAFVADTKLKIVKETFNQGK